MRTHTSTQNQTSSLDNILAASLAAFSMFIVGYTATSVYLSQSPAQNQVIESGVVAHQASMWSTLGQAD